MFRKITKMLVFLTIFSLPLYVIRFELWKMPVTLLEVLVLSSFGFWILDFLIAKKGREIWKFQDNKKDILILLFLLAGSVGILISVDQKEALGIWKAYIVEPVLFFLIVLDLGGEENFKKGVFYSLLSSGILVSLVAISQKITGMNVYAPNEIAQGRVTGFFNSANSLCLFLVPIALMVLAKILVLIKKEKESKEILILGALFVLFLGVIYLTQSTGGMLGMILASGVMVGFSLLSSKLKSLNSKLELRKVLLFVLGIYFLGQILFFQLGLSGMTPKLEERPLVRQFQDTITVRLCLWEGTWEIIENNFLLGVGLASFPENYENYVTCDPELLEYPHNLMLSFWVEMGLWGVFWLFFCLLTWGENTFKVIIIDPKESKVSKTSRYWGIALMGIMIYYLVHGLVDVPYFKNDLSLMWFIFWGISFGL